jgi:hypothetical protein
MRFLASEARKLCRFLHALDGLKEVDVATELRFGAREHT